MDESVQRQDGSGRRDAVGGQRRAGLQRCAVDPADDAVTTGPPPDAISGTVERVKGFAENELIDTLGAGGVGENVNDRQVTMHRRNSLEGRRAHEPFEALFGQIGANEPGTLINGGGSVQA